MNSSELVDNLRPICQPWVTGANSNSSLLSAWTEASIHLSEPQPSSIKKRHSQPIGLLNPNSQGNQMRFMINKNKTHFQCGEILVLQKLTIVLRKL